MRRLWVFFNIFFSFIIHPIFNTIFLVNWMRKTKKVDRSILLICFDGIGDYILFRNFIKILRESEQYKDYKIAICGNLAWKDMAENLDGEYINDFIWIERGKYFSNLLYRYMKINEIASRGFEIAIQPTYSRDYYSDDIIKFVNAKEKIGSAGDLSNIKKWQKNISDKYYTKLLQRKDGIMFEFYRNKEFFEGLLNTKIEIAKPSLDLSKNNAAVAIPEGRYVVIFIGAGHIYRKWSAKYFAEVAKFICENYGLRILICGAEEDRADAIRIKESLPDFEVDDLTAKTPLMDLVLIISKAVLVISNETSVPHLAVALGIPVIVIYNGNHFGRFTPYPPEMTDSYYTCYHPLIKNDPVCYQIISNTYGYSSKLDINEIKPERVIEVVEDCLSKNKRELAYLERKTKLDKPACWSLP